MFSLWRAIVSGIPGISLGVHANMSANSWSNEAMDWRTCGGKLVPMLTVHSGFVGSKLICSRASVG